MKLVSANSVPRHRYQVNQAKVQSNRESRRGRIVGGRDSTIEEFPYQIGLFYIDFHTCGGKIVICFFILLNYEKHPRLHGFISNFIFRLDFKRKYNFISSSLHLVRYHNNVIESH